MLITVAWLNDSHLGGFCMSKKDLLDVHRGTSNAREAGYTYYISGEHTPMS
jgi:hypothetical protein